MKLTKCPLFTVYNSGKFDQDLIGDRISTVKIGGNIYVVTYRDILGNLSKRGGKDRVFRWLAGLL